CLCPGGRGARPHGLSGVLRVRHYGLPALGARRVKNGKGGLTSWEKAHNPWWYRCWWAPKSPLGRASRLSRLGALADTGRCADVLEPAQLVQDPVQVVVGVEGGADPTERLDLGEGVPDGALRAVLALQGLALAHGGVGDNGALSRLLLLVGGCR